MQVRDAMLIKNTKSRFVIINVCLAIVWCQCCYVYTENTYNDEPSLPDLYQELSVKAESETKIEMMGNDSYMTAEITSDSFTVKECPAYMNIHYHA